MNVILTEPVEISLRTLGEEGRRIVGAWFDHLKNWETDEYVRSHSHQLDSNDNVYVLKTSTDIRIFFRLKKPDIVVLDIARKATIMGVGRVSEHSGS